MHHGNYSITIDIRIPYKSWNVSIKNTNGSDRRQVLESKMVQLHRTGTISNIGRMIVSAFRRIPFHLALPRLTNRTEIDRSMLCCSGYYSALHIAKRWKTKSRIDVCYIRAESAGLFDLWFNRETFRSYSMNRTDQTVEANTYMYVTESWFYDWRILPLLPILPDIIYSVKPRKQFNEAISRVLWLQALSIKLSFVLRSRSIR